MNFFSFLIVSLATYRITSLLVSEDGPYGIFNHLRELSGISYDDYGNQTTSGILSEILSCFYCCSFWVALALFLFFYLCQPFIFAVMPFAISGASILFLEFIKDGNFVRE